jgi:AraC-like DNA-binding protein
MKTPKRHQVSRLDHVVDWAEKASRAEYSAGELAKACSISASQLRRFFVRVLGKSPQLWIDELRISRAAVLLLSGDSIKEIANQLNFADSAHFCHQFKVRRHCTPSEFRFCSCGHGPAKLEY